MLKIFISHLLRKKKCNSAKKQFLVMKLVFVFMCAFMINATASVYSQNIQFSFSAEGKSIKDVFRLIEKESQFRFLYNDDFTDLNRLVTIDVKDSRIESILDRILNKSEITYRILENNLIVITPVEMMLQGIAITGIVTDVDGDLLPGVNVVIKGTAYGTVTDVNGTYSLSVPDENATLLFSFVGYATQEILVGSQRAINVALSEATRKIEEVVVVGYGIQKKSTLTGSVVAVESKELVTTKNTNIQNMLTGKLPGVRNIQKTSEPGAFTNQFDIRGMGAPLIIVDGVPRDNFPRMDPNDVESISVLKDASAAVYGVRGANGVILITTKSGEKGKAKIEYSGYYGIQVPAERLQPLNAWNRALLANEISMRSVSSPTKTYADKYFEDLAEGKFPDTDWYAEMMRKTAPQQQHNVSVSGGSDKIDFFINLGYTDQGSFWKTNSNNYNRYNLRTNLNAQITNRLKVGVKLNAIMDETNRQFRSSQEIFKAMWRSTPDDYVYSNNEEGYFYHVPNIDINNVVAAIQPELSGFVKNNRTIFQSNLHLDYDVPYIKGLKAQFMFSYDKTMDDNTEFRKEYKVYRYNDQTETQEGNWTENSPTRLNRLYRNIFGTLWNARLNYDNTFAGVHHAGALLLYEERYHQSYDLSATRNFEFPIPFLFAGNSDENQIGTGSGLSEYANKALVGRFNYDYAGKYLFEYSFRYDGSSSFPKGKQWGFFPSVLVGYRISEESFIKDNISFVQNLKIRATWGQVGDDRAISYQWIEGIDYPVQQSDFDRPNRAPLGYVFGNTFVNAVGFRNAPNPNITWYSAVMKNIGVDADMLNGLFGFSLDLFQRDRKDLLASPTVVIPGTFGSGVSQANLESDRTKGLEVELRHRNKIDKFNYHASTFVQVTRNMVTKRTQPPRSNSADHWRNNLEGRYNDIMFGWGAAGTYQSWDEIANSIYAGNGTLPGDPIREDWNGDGVIDDNDVYPIATTTSNDGNRLPNANMQDARNYPLMNFGLTLGGNWKWIDFSFHFQGAAMSWVGYSEQLLSPLMWNGNALELLFDRWHPSDPDIDPFAPSVEWISGYYPYGSTRAPANSAFNIQNGAYLRLKSAEVGFTVPKNIVFEKIGVKNMRLYFNAYNLLTITGVKGLDPEKPSEQHGYLYPLNRTFNFGGSITF